MSPIALPGELREGDPAMDWWDVRPMRQVIAESGAIRGRRFVVRLLGGFAALALVLAGVGFYGVMAYFVAERRREIAVRVALGATRPRCLKQVLGEAVRLLADRSRCRCNRRPVPHPVDREPALFGVDRDRRADPSRRLRGARDGDAAGELPTGPPRRARRSDCGAERVGRRGRDARARANLEP